MNRNVVYLIIGALAVAISFPLLRDQYGIGGEGGLTSPISVKWAGFAELLSAVRERADRAHPQDSDGPRITTLPMTARGRGSRRLRTR